MYWFTRACTNRILIFFLVFDNVIKSPIKGVCWFLDELLYHFYHNTEIKNPVFILSSAHSGSTQMKEYLDDKESSMKFEGWFPYIWFWRLVWSKFKILGSYTWLRTDDFFSWSLGSSFFNWRFIYSSLKENPINEEFCKCFVELRK